MSRFMVKQELKDFGRRMIFQGAEVEFQKKVREREKIGISRDEAEKTIFTESMNSALDELRLTGPLAPESKAFREFRAGLGEVFGKETINQFREDAEDPVKWRALALPPVTPRQLADVKGYFSRRHEGKTPEFPILNDTAINTKLIAECLRRVLADPELATPQDLKTIIDSHPELGADLGKILLAKSAVERHERRFGRGVDFENAAEKWKEDARETAIEMLFRAPFNFVKAFGKSLISWRFEIFAKGLTELVGREAWAGSKFVAKSAKAIGFYVRKKWPT